MLNWIRKLVGRNPRLMEADRRLTEINGRVDALVERATIDGESKWMLRIEREKRFPQMFECQEVKEDGS